MRHHPLTPMTDPNLVRVLQRQTARQVGLLPLRRRPTRDRTRCRQRLERARRPAACGTSSSTPSTTPTCDTVAAAARGLRCSPAGPGWPARSARSLGDATSAGIGGAPAICRRARRRPGRLLLGRDARPGRRSRAVLPSLPARPGGDPRPRRPAGRRRRRGCASTAARARCSIYSSAGPEQRAAGPRGDGTRHRRAILERTLGALAREAVGARRAARSWSPAGRPPAPSSRRSASAAVVGRRRGGPRRALVPDHRRAARWPCS